MAYVAIHMRDNAYLRKSKTGWVTTSNITAAYVHPAKRQIEDTMTFLQNKGVDMTGWSIADTKSAAKLIRNRGGAVKTLYEISDANRIEQPVAKKAPLPLSCAVNQPLPSSDYANKLMDKVDQIHVLISDTYMSELSAKLSEADKLVVDIYHYIEATNFNACQGYKLCKKLQKALVERRKIKNEYTLINRVRQCNIPTRSHLQNLAERQWQPQVDILTMEVL